MRANEIESRTCGTLVSQNTLLGHIHTISTRGSNFQGPKQSSSDGCRCQLAFEPSDKFMEALRTHQCKLRNLNFKKDLEQYKVSCMDRTTVPAYIVQIQRVKDERENVLERVASKRDHVR